MSADTIEVTIPFVPGCEPDPREFTNLNSTPHEVQKLITEAAEHPLFRSNNNLLAVKHLSPNSQDKLYFYYLLATPFYHLKYFRHNDGPCFEPIPSEIRQYSHIIFIQKPGSTDPSETIRIPLLLSEELVKQRFSK